MTCLMSLALTFVVALGAVVGAGGEYALGRGFDLKLVLMEGIALTSIYVIWGWEWLGRDPNSGVRSPLNVVFSITILYLLSVFGVISALLIKYMFMLDPGLVFFGALLLMGISAASAGIHAQKEEGEEA